MGCKSKSMCGRNCCCIECEELETCTMLKCDVMDSYEFARECEDYVEDLKPCPFCGGKVDVLSAGMGYSAGCFYENYSIKCNNCGVEFDSRSKFYVENGIPHIKYDGYQEVVDRWNRRPAENVKEK